MRGVVLVVIGRHVALDHFEADEHLFRQSGFDAHAKVSTGEIVSCVVVRSVTDRGANETVNRDVSGILPRQFANVGAQTQFGIANPVDVIGTFIGGVQIGVAIGIAVTLAIGLLKGWISRRWGEDVGGQILISLLMPFAAYLAAEAIHASGILAAVAATMVAEDKGGGGGVEQVIVMVFLLFLPPQFQFLPLVATPNIFLRQVLFYKPLSSLPSLLPYLPPLLQLRLGMVQVKHFPPQLHLWPLPKRTASVMAWTMKHRQSSMQGLHRPPEETTSPC